MILSAGPPAEADIQQYFGVSPPSVHQMLLTLEQMGLIRRQPRIARNAYHLAFFPPGGFASERIIAHYLHSVRCAEITSAFSAPEGDQLQI